MNQNIVRDAKGNILYRAIYLSNETKVYDGGSTLLGRCYNGQTRDVEGRIIAQSESPGLLVKISHK